MKRIALPFLLAAFAAASFATTLPQITLTETPASVEPGGVIGLGFTLTNNNPSDYVVLTGSDFTGTPVYGTYRDYLATGPLYVAGPSPESATITQPWNGSSMLGVGEFDTFATDPSGTTVAGSIDIHYSVFSQDPNSPTFDPGSQVGPPDNILAVPVTFVVSPEPASVALTGIALAGIVLGGIVLSLRKRRAV